MMSYVFVVCAVTLISCVAALSVALQAQLKYERYITNRMKIEIMKIDQAMQSDNRGKESY